MKAHRYTYASTIQFDGDEPFAELEVEVSYEVAWGSPESGRWGPPEDYDPGSASVVEAVRVETINDQPKPWNPEGAILAAVADDLVEAHICAALAHADEAAEMIQAAVEDDASRRDSYLEQEAKDDRYEREPAYDYGDDW
jgi:hypothetical protein